MRVRALLRMDLPLLATTSHARQMPIEGAATPEEHMAWVYDHMLTQARADHVVLVGYGHGARLCKEMLRRSLTVRSRY